MADDKIPALDPAAAPLATDSEGGGAPLPPTPPKPDHPHPDTFGAHARRRRTDPLGILLVAAAVILALAGVATGLWGLR